MNKLITTNNGGFPVVLDDLRFEQQAVRDTFMIATSKVLIVYQFLQLIFDCSEKEN